MTRSIRLATLVLFLFSASSIALAQDPSAIPDGRRLAEGQTCYTLNMTRGGESHPGEDHRHRVDDQARHVGGHGRRGARCGAGQEVIVHKLSTASATAGPRAGSLLRRGAWTSQASRLFFVPFR